MNTPNLFLLTILALTISAFSYGSQEDSYLQKILNGEAQKEKDKAERFDLPGATEVDKQIAWSAYEKCFNLSGGIGLPVSKKCYIMTLNNLMHELLRRETRKTINK